jgi:hypothetical protein
VIVTVAVFSKAESIDLNYLLLSRITMFDSVRLPARFEGVKLVITTLGHVTVDSANSRNEGPDVRH